MQGLYHMLVEEQKYLEKIIDKLRKELLTAPEGWRLCSFVLTGNSRAFFVRIQMSFLCLPDYSYHISFLLYLFHYGIDRECGKRLKKDVYPMTWLLAMFSFLLCYRKSELFRSF